MPEAMSGAPLEDDMRSLPSEPDWLAMTKDAQEHSESFLNAYLRVSWERSLDQFNSRHPSGSKYQANEYKGRSKLFRPKTRATIRRGEAASAAAFFSTLDVVNISAVDDSDPNQLASAEVTNALVNYRLTKTIPWFLTLQGGYQVGQIQGVIASKQYWSYKERIKTLPTMDIDEMGRPILDEMGKPSVRDQDHTRIEEDKPVIKLLPPENLRLHEGSDWTSPVQSSPFIIEMIPMFAGDVKQRAKQVDKKTGQPEWIMPLDGQLQQARIDASSSIRQKRSGYDPMNTTQAVEPVKDSQMVWVYEVIYRRDGEDLHWYTLSDLMMLCDPQPLEEVYKHGRPYVLGYGMLEALTVFPTSKVANLHDLQAAANDIENLRLDNIKLALHPRTRIRAGQQISAEAATSGAPGSVLFLKDPAGDIVYDRPPDVTNSAYEEQNYLNNDFDELAGTFSPGSVQSNRTMGDTATGMAMIGNGMNALTEYDLRVFAETWVEPVLRQLVKLEQQYETDTTIIALAGKQAGVLERYGLDPLMDDLLSADLTVTVNVGIGMTDPSQRLQRFLFAVNSYAQLAGGIAQMFGPSALQSPGAQAIAKEIFGAAGYKDGARFLDFGSQGQDPQVAQMQQYIQQLQQQMQQMHAVIQGKQIESQTKLQIETAKDQTEQFKAAAEMQTEHMKAGAQVQTAHLQAVTQARSDMLKAGAQAHAAVTGAASRAHQAQASQNTALAVAALNAATQRAKQLQDHAFQAEQNQAMIGQQGGQAA